MKRKTLQDRMVDMKPYFKGIEMYNEALIVKVMFPEKWKPYDSSDGRIKATRSENVPNEVYYYANSEDTTYDDIFDFVEETIKANQDIILKVKLLRDKVEELKDMFSTHTYDELTTLKFVFGDVKRPQGRRKYARKEKEPQSENKVDSEESENNGEETEATE